MSLVIAKGAYLMADCFDLLKILTVNSYCMAVHTFYVLYLCMQCECFCYVCH